MSFCHYFSVIETCATRQVWKMVMMLRAIFSSRSSATIGVLMMKPDDYIGQRDRKINDLWLLIERTRNETKREEVFDEKLVDEISRNRNPQPKDDCICICIRRKYELIIAESWEINSII